MDFFEKIGIRHGCLQARDEDFYMFDLVVRNVMARGMLENVDVFKFAKIPRIMNIIITRKLKRP